MTPPASTTAAVFVALAASASAWLALRARKKPLAVRLSRIPGAGQGLFVQREFGKGEVVCRYTGVSRTMREAFRLQDKSYLMRLGHKNYIDARTTLQVVARYINDCRNPALYNVVFDKKPEEGHALVVATRNIAAGEELYASYGKWYWVKTKGTRLESKKR